MGWEEEKELLLLLTHHVRPRGEQRPGPHVVLDAEHPPRQRVPCNCTHVASQVRKMSGASRQQNNRTTQNDKHETAKKKAHNQSTTT